MDENSLKTIIAETVAGAIKDMGMDKIDQKYIVIPSEKSEKEQLALTEKQKFGELAKALINKDYFKVKEVNTELMKAADPNNMTTNADGGYLVPDVTSAEILQLISSYGQARSVFNVGGFPKSVDNLTIPKESTGINVYYPGEQGTITSSKPLLTYLTLTCKKAAAIAVLTNELKEFASVDFVNYLQNLAAKGFATDEDSKCFGTGNSVFTGLFYASNSFGKMASVDNANEISYNAIMEAIYGIDSAKLANASWLMHRTIMEKVRGIVDLQGRPLFYDANGGTPATLAGFPVKLIENGVPTSATTTASQPLMILGNFQNSFLKEKSGMRIDLSTDAYVDASSMFPIDCTAIRFIRHWTFHPGNTENYTGVMIKAAS